MSYIIPLALLAFAVAVLAAGLPFSGKFLRRGRYITGLILTALSFAIFWPLHIMISDWVIKWGIYGVLALLPFLVSVALFGIGLALVSKANNTARDDHYDSLLP